MLLWMELGQEFQIGFSTQLAKKPLESWLEGILTSVAPKGDSLYDTCHMCSEKATGSVFILQ